MTVEANEETRILVELDVKAVGCEDTPAPPPKIVLERLRDHGKVRISGTVTNGVAGFPGVSVTLRRADGFVQAAFTLTDGTGAYKMEGVPPAVYELIIEENNYVPVIVGNVRVEKGYETKLSPAIMRLATIICL